MDLVKVLPLPLFGRASAADIKTVVKESFSKNNTRFETVRRGEQLLIRAAHKRPTDHAVQVGALDAEPRLVDLGPRPHPVRCARCASTRNLELPLPTGRWINLPMEQRLFCEQANSLHANGKEATTATQDATAMAEETIWRTRV